MTNSHLELPSFLMDWLQIRDRVRSQAFAGDSLALDPLWQALQNPESDIRCEAAILLRHIKDSRSVDPLIAVLNDPVIKVRTNAADTLGVLADKRAADALHLAIPQIGNTAAIALHQLGDPRGKEYFLSLLTDGSLEQRRSAIMTLGTLHDSTVIETLIANLADPDRGVRWGAAWSLGELRDPRAIRALIIALAEEVQITPKDAVEAYPVRAILRSALARLGGPEAVWALEHYT
jgi:HEAT repeat protein